MNYHLRASTSTGFRAPTVGQANVVNTATSLVNGELIQSFLAPPTDPLSAFYGGKELDARRVRVICCGYCLLVR